ncbi:MAG: hypothetical protein IJI22_04930 [Bacilli bacterium]|nr:hypothetical protein [Bacilli bacterium]
MSNKKYLFVKADEAYKIKYREEREAAFNDFDTVPVREGEENIERFFAERNIPKKYWKLVIVIPKNLKLNSLKSTIEYVTHMPFVIKGEKTNGGYYISGVTKEKSIYSVLRFNSLAETVDFEEIKKFYIDLEEDGFLDNYFDMLLQIFGFENSIIRDEVFEKVAKAKIKAYNEIVERK